MAETFSNTPWSNFKESDYTPQQWMSACLIQRADGSCALPVREPDGTVNKNALSAAAGALAGARGGVRATPEEKAKASATLRRLYAGAGMEPPPSLKHTALDRLANFFKAQGLSGIKLVHFGVKGQKWGVHRSDAQLSSVSSDSLDAVRASTTLSAIQAKGSLSAASDADLNHLINRINTEKRYAEINPSSFERGHKAIKTTLDVGRTMNEVIKFANSPAGKLLSSALRGTTKGRHATPASQILKAAGKKSKK